VPIKRPPDAIHVALHHDSGWHRTGPTKLLKIRKKGRHFRAGPGSKILGEDRHIGLIFVHRNTKKSKTQNAATQKNL
jgi:hypothetical protein